MVKRITWLDLKELAATIPSVLQETLDELEEKTEGILHEIHILDKRYGD